MPIAKTLSDAQVDLIKRLIEFAEENDFFESEFDDEHQRRTYGELWTVADELYEELSSAEKVSQGATEPVSAVTIGQAITSGNGKPWWDISSFKQGLNPNELRKQLQELRDRLRALLFYSDSLDVRQAILKAVYALQSTERYFAIQSSSEAGEKKSNR